MTQSAPSGIRAAEEATSLNRNRVRGRIQRHANRSLALFATPALVWYAVFMIGPLIAVFLISFLRWPGLLAQPEWSGFANYIRVFTDPNFWNAVRVTFLLLIGTVPATVVVAFMLGYYLSRNPPGVRFLRSVLFIPGLISLAAITMVFVAIFSPNGLINSVLNSLGLDKYTQAWLANPNTALLCIIVISLWGAIGYNSILFASALAGVDTSLYEAAVLDGAGQWRIMWRVAFPITIDYFGVMTMIQYLWNIFGSAAVLLLLYGTAPPLSTTTMSWLVYQKAFVQSDIGYSQAVGVVLFFAGLVGILIIRRVFRPRF